MLICSIAKSLKNPANIVGEVKKLFIALISKVKQKIQEGAVMDLYQTRPGPSNQSAG